MSARQISESNPKYNPTSRHNWFPTIPNHHWTPSDPTLRTERQQPQSLQSQSQVKITRRKEPETGRIH